MHSVAGPRGSAKLSILRRLDLEGSYSQEIGKLGWDGGQSFIDSVAISLQSHFEITSVLQRSLFGSTSVSRRFHFCLFPVSLRSHVDLT